MCLLSFKSETASASQKDDVICQHCAGSPCDRVHDLAPIVVVEVLVLWALCARVFFILRIASPLTARG